MVTSELVDDASAAARLFADLARASENLWIASAWAARWTPMAGALWTARARIRALVVGVDGFFTDPAFLERFRQWVRIKRSPGGIFHPKVYLFQRGDEFNAIIGSSNLTDGGFRLNLEANLHLSGSSDEPSFRQLKSFIEDLANHSVEYTEADIEAYRKDWVNAKVRSARFDGLQSEEHRLRPSPELIAVAILQADWSSFIQLLQESRATSHDLLPNVDGESYLDVINEVGRIFVGRNSLSKMTREERDHVGGLRDDRFAYFGTMRGAGVFGGMLRHQPEELDAALTAIPLRPGQVTRAQFDSFVHGLPAVRGLGSPGVGSRLLAMKRPDVFLCLNNRNREGISKAVGISRARLQTYEGYWELHERLWKCPWYVAPRPEAGSGAEDMIWDSRMALVDAVFYED